MKKNNVYKCFNSFSIKLPGKIIVSILLALILLLPLTEAIAQCGPGAHWIDGCMAGNDEMETFADVGINLDISNCTLPADMQISLIGPTIVSRSDPKDILVEIGTETLATVDGHFDVIETEIISMNMVSQDGSIKMIAGEGLGQGGVLPKSIGYIIEDPTDNTKGKSVFFVYVEIEAPNPMGGLMYLYNHDSLLLATVIDSVPPIYSDYIHGVFSSTVLCEELYTHPVAGVWVANLVDATHTPVPTLPQWALLIFGLLLLSFGCVFIYKHQLISTNNAYAESRRVTLNNLPLSQNIYINTLTILLLLVGIGLFIINLYGLLTITDFIGTLISSFIFAYIIHLGIIIRKK